MPHKLTPKQKVHIERLRGFQCRLTNTKNEATIAKINAEREEYLINWHLANHGANVIAMAMPESQYGCTAMPSGRDAQ